MQLITKMVKNRLQVALCAAAPRRRRRRFFHAAAAVWKNQRAAVAAADEITGGVIGGVTLLSPIEALPGLIRLMAESLNRLIADENNKSSLQSTVLLYTIKGMGFLLKFFENTTH